MDKQIQDLEEQQHQDKVMMGGKEYTYHLIMEQVEVAEQEKSGQMELQRQVEMVEMDYLMI